MSADEKSVTITFFNGDVKQILADGKVVCQIEDPNLCWLSIYLSLVDVTVAYKRVNVSVEEMHFLSVCPTGLLLS